MNDNNDDLMAYFGQYNTNNDDSVDVNDNNLINDNDQYCQGDNYESKWKSLKDTLSMHSYAMPNDISELPVTKQVKLINVLYRLFQDQKHQQNALEDYQTQIGTIFDDHKRVVTKLDLIEEELKKEKKEKWEIEMRRRQLEEEFINTTSKLKSQLNQVTKENVMIKHRDNQYKHELRKRERQQEKHKQQLQKLIQDRTRERPSNMEILNTLKSEKRSMWKGGKRGEEELHQQAIGIYEQRLNDLKTENHLLREAVTRFNEKLQEYLEKHGNVLVTVGDDEEITVNVHISQHMADTLQQFNADSQMKMPYSSVQNQVEDALNARLEILNEKMSKLKVLSDQQASDDLVGLRQQLKESLDIISKQDDFIRAHLKGNINEIGEEKHNRRWSGLEDWTPHPERHVQRSHSGSFVHTEIHVTPGKKSVSHANFMDVSTPQKSDVVPFSLDSFRSPKTPAGINLDESFQLSEEGSDFSNDDDDDDYDANN